MKFSPAIFLLLKRIVLLAIFLNSIEVNAGEYQELTFKAGDKSLQYWLLPPVEHPTDNSFSPERVALGKMLFFDPRLSGDGNMSCATCHNPLLGWSDGLATAKGAKSNVLNRASLTIINTAYNSLYMWDGRKNSLEEQVMAPMISNLEMNMDIPKLLNLLRESSDYKRAFYKAYPTEKINRTSLAKAIAAFERTIVSNNSPFDQWVSGDESALTEQQIAGFKLFVNPKKGNCSVCHSAPNFTDNGFHNIGLAQFAEENADMGRYSERPLKLMKGAFKTPTLRDVSLTAPYFHDGSAKDLEEVVNHYENGGVAKGNLSPNMKVSILTVQERAAIVAFMNSLTTKPKPFTLPIIPH